MVLKLMKVREMMGSRQKIKADAPITIADIPMLVALIREKSNTSHKMCMKAQQGSAAKHSEVVINMPSGDADEDHDGLDDTDFSNAFNYRFPPRNTCS